MAKTCKACNNPVFAKDYCQRHQYLRLDKIAKPLNPKKPINAISKKTRQKVAKYSELRLVFLSEYPLCQCRGQHCSSIATEVHHSKGRGKYLLDTSTYIALCHNCHVWVEMHPKEAKELNYSQSRLN